MQKRMITIVLTVCMLFLICTQAMADNTVHNSEFISDREKYTVAELVPDISSDMASKLTVIVKINPASKVLQIAGKVASIGNTSVSVASSFNLDVGVPTPVKGQYYRTETWYINNQIYCRVTVWQNKTAFNNGSSPLYIGTKYVQSNLPTF